MQVYADNAATTRMSDKAVAAMTPYFQQFYGNPSSLHTVGQQAAEALADARRRVADCLGCSFKEITFTSGGSEADNQAIVSAARIGERKGKKRLRANSTSKHCASTGQMGQCAAWQSCQAKAAINAAEHTHAAQSRAMSKTARCLRFMGTPPVRWYIFIIGMNVANEWLNDEICLNYLCQISPDSPFRGAWILYTIVEADFAHRFPWRWRGQGRAFFGGNSVVLGEFRHMRPIALGHV